jgi:Asp/Glu/hydantoin racemase
VLKGEKALLRPFVEAAKELEQEGVSAITTSCGFLSPFQDALAKELSVPVFASTLMLLPLVHRMLGRGQKVGVITADSSSLTPGHFEGVGAADVPVAIEGLQNTTAFADCFLRNGTSFDPEAVEKEVVDAARLLSRKNKDVGAIVFECANLAPYSEAVQREVRLPVFDIITFINMIHNSIEMADRFGPKIL